MDKVVYVISCWESLGIQGHPETLLFTDMPTAREIQSLCRPESWFHQAIGTLPEAFDDCYLRPAYTAVRKISGDNAQCAWNSKTHTMAIERRMLHNVPNRLKYQGEK